MPPAQPEIVVQIAQQFAGLDIEPKKIEELVKTVFERFEVDGATVSIAIIDERRFCEVNSRFRKSKSTSDCLSFDLSEDPEAKSERLFELVVNGEMAVRQALLRKHSSQAELALYITHGLLHNLGFDDAVEDQATKMHNTEDEILKQLGYGLVYNTQIKTEQPGRRTDA